MTSKLNRSKPSKLKPHKSGKPPARRNVERDANALLYDMEQTCRLLSICRSTVYALIEVGKLERVQLHSRSVRITRKSINKLLATAAA